MQLQSWQKEFDDSKGFLLYLLLMNWEDNIFI